MRQARLQATSVHPAGDQSPAFERCDGLGVGQPVECRLGQGLTQGGQLQRAALGVGQMAQADGHQVHQAGGRLQAAAQAPDPAFLAQRTVLDSPHDQFVQEEGIAKRPLRYLSQRHGVDRASEHGDQKVFDRQPVERAEFDPRRAMVLPQHDHGLPAARAGAPRWQDAGDHGGGARLHELMDEGRRTVVEEVCIVDEDEQRPPTGIVEKLVHVAAELISVRLGTDEVRVAVEERGECSERVRPGCLGSRHEGHRHLQITRVLDADRRQDGLADPRRPHDDRAASAADRSLQVRDLVRTADERPRFAGSEFRPGRGVADMSRHRICPLENRRGHFRPGPGQLPAMSVP